MPTVKLQSGSLMPEGEHVLTLTSVEEIEQENIFRRKPTDPATRVRWVWRFRSDQLDQDGEPYEHSEWTNPKYGSARASLTALLNSLVPGMNKEQADHFNTESLVGKEFDAMITHGANTKGDTVSNIAFIRPKGFVKSKSEMKRLAAQEPKPKTDDEIPF